MPPGLDFPDHREQILQATCDKDTCISPATVDAYLNAVDKHYIARSYPERVARHIRAWQSLMTQKASLEVDES